YEMETSFTQAKMWGKLADAITETGLQKFDQSYRMGEILRELVSQKEHDALNRLMKAGLKDMPLQQMGDLFYSVTRGDFKLDPEVGELLVEKLESKDFISASSNNLNYVYSRSSGGQTTGFLNGMAHILHQDPKIEERAIEILSKRLEGEKAHLVDRMLLAMVYSQRKDIEGVRRAVEPLISKKKKNAQEVEAIWSIASELTHGTNSPELACELLESVEPAALAEDQGSGFEYSAMALLAEAYQKAKRNSDARRILVEHMISMEVDTEQDQHNPGYGDYQYISSQAALARSFLAMGYPAEAFIAFRKAYSDESRLERASRWGSSSTRQRDSLAQEIA